MSYRGMGQVVVSAPVSVNWPAIERFARNAAGGVVAQVVSVFESSRARGAREASYTAALRSLADTIAVRPLAMSWLAKPAREHRAGLLAIAEFARRNAGAARAQPARQVASPAPAAVPAARAPSAPSVDLVAQARAELAKPRALWHRDTAEIMVAVDRAVADRAALREFLLRLLPGVTGDARAALAFLIVRLEQADAATRIIPVPPPPTQSTSADAGWAAYQSWKDRAGAGPAPLGRAQHDQFWSGLTEPEKLAGFWFYAATAEQVYGPLPSDPAKVSFMRKFLPLVAPAATAPTAAPQQTEQMIVGTESGPVATSGLGNYIRG